MTTTPRISWQPGLTQGRPGPGRGTRPAHEPADTVYLTAATPAASPSCRCHAPRAEPISRGEILDGPTPRPPSASTRN